MTLDRAHGVPRVDEREAQLLLLRAQACHKRGDGAAAERFAREAIDRHPPVLMMAQERAPLPGAELDLKGTVHGAWLLLAVCALERRDYLAARDCGTQSALCALTRDQIDQARAVTMRATTELVVRGVMPHSALEAVLGTRLDIAPVLAREMGVVQEELPSSRRASRRPGPAAQPLAPGRRVSIRGARWAHLLQDAPVRTTRLRDGSTGYYVRGARADDCMAAAIATCLQVPITEVPDPRIDERLAAGESIEAIDRTAQAELVAWLADRDLAMVTLDPLPRRAPERWIGIVPMPGEFNSHCVVMAHSEMLFDPVEASPRIRRFRADEVGYGIAFRPTKPQPRR